MASAHLSQTSEAQPVPPQTSGFSHWRNLRALRRAISGSTALARVDEDAAVADVQLAQLRSLAWRINKVVPSAHGRCVSPAGVRCEIVHLPLFGRVGWSFDVPVAVHLLLRFWLLATLFLVLAFALATPQLIDNRRRSVARNECRAALTELYDVIVRRRSEDDRRSWWRSVRPWQGGAARQALRSLPG